jgi:alpha-amylase/alpha-mannosidase (GH57 family)
MLANAPLPVVFLWHQHQPDYRTESGFFLPWVRLHACKDYAELPQRFSMYSVRQTMNIVPSLCDQLAAYSKEYTDPLERLSRIPSHELTSEQKVELFSWFRTATSATFRDRAPGFDKYFQRVLAGEWKSWLPRDWCDAVVLFHLMWIGSIQRQRPAIQRLLAKGSSFTETDKTLVLDEMLTIVASTIPILRQAQHTGVLELSTTPYHHPIAPLLFDTNVAARSTRGVLPSPAIRMGADARWHVQEAHRTMESTFGKRPAGIWPAEGSVSDDTLAMFIENNVQWVASDEYVLFESIDRNGTELESCTPVTYLVGEKRLTLLFRNRKLSDAIGFDYSTWQADAAVEHFVQTLLSLRLQICQVYGEDSLARAAVTIVLDGENCWEFYPNNGDNFLHALFTRLEHEQQQNTLQTITASDAAKREGWHAPLHSIWPGSWINSSFDIWIGTELKNRAWYWLGQASIAAGGNEHLCNIVRGAQASDYFWWYHSAHQAEHKYRFDEEFRLKIRTVLQQSNCDIPDELFKANFGLIDEDQVGNQQTTGAMTRSAQV